MELKDFNKENCKLLEKWLNKPFILKWYKDPSLWLDEVINIEYEFVHKKIVYIDDKPIGFCQYYDCYYAKEDWYTVEKENTTYSIDYLIGEEDYLKKGYGKEIVKSLVKIIGENHNYPLIIVKPEEENIVSKKTLFSSGFLYDEENDYFCYKEYAYGYCGMPCGLCTRYHINGNSKCMGCNRNGYYAYMCKVNKCSNKHCGLCSKFPCPLLEKMKDFRDLCTDNCMIKTCEKVKIDFDAWYIEYNQKCILLEKALINNNDGRMKRYLCELFIQNDLEKLKEIVFKGKNLKGKEFIKFVGDIL